MDATDSQKRELQQAIFNTKQALIIAALVCVSFVLGFVIGAILL